MKRSFSFFLSVIFSVVFVLSPFSAQALAPESHLVSRESSVDLLLEQWVEQWRVAHRISEKIRITHQMHSEPDLYQPGNIFLKGELVLFL